MKAVILDWQDTHAAVNASEEAAEAVEEVADRVEALDNKRKEEVAVEGEGSVKLDSPEGTSIFLETCCLKLPVSDELRTVANFLM